MSVLQCLSAMLNANGKRNTGVAITGKDTAINFFIVGGFGGLLYSFSYKDNPTDTAINSLTHALLGFHEIKKKRNTKKVVSDVCSIVIGGGFYSVGVMWTIKALISWVNTLDKYSSIKDPAQYAEIVNNRKVAYTSTIHYTRSSVNDGIVNDYSLIVLVTTSCLLTFASYQLCKHGRALFHSFEEKEE